MFPSLLLRKKAFPFLDSLIYLRFLIRNLNPAIPFLHSVSAHCLHLFSTCML
jgi:hypothetical protein